MGELHERMNNPGTALGFYCVAIERKPNYGEAWMGKARCYVKLGQWNEAIITYNEILDKIGSMGKIDYRELYYSLAMCYYKRGDHQGAIDRLYLALNESPEDFQSHLALAKIFDEEKHISSALKQYQQALSCKPKDYDVRTINKRVLYLESQLKENQPPPVVIKLAPVKPKEEEPVFPADGGF